jgi:hypothetical protein
MSDVERALPGATRRRPPSRRFAVVDGMILVAASAVGFALAGLWGRELTTQLPTFFLGATSTAARSRFAGGAMAALVPATFAWLVLRRRPPRLHLRRMSRRPGSVACGVAASMLVAHAACLPLSMRTMGGLTSPFLVAAWYWPESIAAGVLASWALLLVTGRWQAGTDWVDRFGMLIGACWIALPLALAVVEFS